MYFCTGDILTVSWWVLVESLPVFGPTSKGGIVSVPTQDQCHLSVCVLWLHRWVYIHEISLTPRNASVIFPHPCPFHIYVAYVCRNICFSLITCPYSTWYNYMNKGCYQTDQGSIIYCHLPTQSLFFYF